MFVLGKVKNQFALLKYYFKYPVNRENGFGKIYLEGFRAFAGDRGIFTLFNRGEKLEQGKDGLLTTETRKKVAKSVIDRLSSEVCFQGHRRTLHEVIREQACNVKNHLYNKAQYNPFLGRW